MVSEAIGRKIIQCQPHMQYKPNTKLRDLLKSKKAEIRKLSMLSKPNKNKLVKLNGMLNELKREENVQNQSKVISWQSVHD